MMNNTFSLAAIARSFHGNLSRNQLKVARARMRRAGVTNLSKGARGAYTVNPTTDAQTDVCADSGTIVAQVASMVWA